jgi:ABC-type methionine transport system ATPase subunit
MAADAQAPVIAIRDLVKDYRGLRPLRIRSLVLGKGERAVVVGFDAASAEALVSLITGASLPDQGQVAVFGRTTADISSSDEWLATLDRFGIVSDRVVLLDELTVAQNLAVPLTLEIDPLTAGLSERVANMAREVGLDRATLSSRAATVSPLDRARLRLARAIALEPQVLLLEHPSASLDSSDTQRFVEDVTRVSAARGLSVLALTADDALATLASDGPWRWVPASGEVGRAGRARWLRW